MSSKLWTNSKCRFGYVYDLVERLRGRIPTTLEIERAYKRYLKVMDEEERA